MPKRPIHIKSHLLDFREMTIANVRKKTIHKKNGFHV